MQIKMRSLFLYLLAFTLVMGLGTAAAADIKARMKARLPQIVELKAEGILGEDNRGFLAFVGETRKNEAVVDAENKDRSKVYAAIAKQQGADADSVGRRRAMQIAAKAKPGEWLQDTEGKWYRKK